MKKMNKKGFTIVELVIVIAVIAILAGVMIPTFSGIVEKAEISKVKQQATALYKECYAIDYADGAHDGLEGTTPVAPTDANFTYKYEAPEVGAAKVWTVTYVSGEYTATYANGVWTVVNNND